jgi:hypothetical protein
MLRRGATPCKHLAGGLAMPCSTSVASARQAAWWVEAALQFCCHVHAGSPGTPRAEWTGQHACELYKVGGGAGRKS